MEQIFAPGALVRERYEVQALIGQGSMGAVYRVADHRLPGRLCALKVMRAENRGVGETGDDDALRRQFLTEASTLGRLDHSNLPKVSDYFSLDQFDCLVMDYVPGQDLGQRIADARRRGAFLPLEDVLSWIDQLCDVLIFLHTQQPPMIHGDVKPANIKLTAEGRIKLVDFGLVRPADPTDPRTVTGAGLRGIGSLPYAALEQYASTKPSVDPRSDLYSLGATLYHLVTNQAPASAHDRFLDPDALKPPIELNPDIPIHLEEAILAAMRPHPADRPASVIAWRRMLAPSLQLDGANAEVGRFARSFELARVNRWYFAGAITLVVLAVALTLLR